MTYSQTLTVICPGVVAAALTSLFLPLWRANASRLGLVDDPGNRKIHDQRVTLSGGPAVLSSLVLTTVLAWIAFTFLREETIVRELLGQLEQRAVVFTATGIGAIAMALLGMLDDRFELRPIGKFLGQFIIASGVTAAGVRINLFEHSPSLSIAITILWILTVTNAFNFVDNMNGLCAGLGAIAAGFAAILALVNGDLLASIIGFSFAGAILGFLPYNYPNASSFLGDSGSHLIGFLLAVIAIDPGVWRATQNVPLGMATPLVLLAIPVVDLCWVVTFRTMLGRPFYVGDNNHLSHQLVRRGLSRTNAVGVLWILSALAGCIAFALR